MTDEKNSALKRLERLVGQWQIEFTLPTEPQMVVQPQAAFEWMALQENEHGKGSL